MNKPDQSGYYLETREQYSHETRCRSHTWKPEPRANAGLDPWESFALEAVLEAFRVIENNREADPGTEKFEIYQQAVSFLLDADRNLFHLNLTFCDNQNPNAWTRQAMEAILERIHNGEQTATLNGRKFFVDDVGKKERVFQSNELKVKRYAAR